ncbi:MAG: outer membrane protein assembly factor [Mediterranea sp.]|jgi:outer membrane protein assembly factor BamA|nr:outer membrane protein assembly factor [Mediterranea sp.]
MRKYVLPIIAALLSVDIPATAQPVGDSLSTLSRYEPPEEQTPRRNLRYNILGGPAYTPDFGLLIGGSALMTFSMDPTDTTLRRSVVPMGIALQFKGGLNLSTKPQLFFPGDRFRIFGKFAYKNTQDNYYGIGYHTNKEYPRGKTTSQYRYSGFQINPWFLFRLGRSDFFAGPQIDFSYDRVSKPAAGMRADHAYIGAGGTERGYSRRNAGLGFLLTYDSRDIPANAYRGLYLDFRGVMYGKAFGGQDYFYRLELDYRQYRSVKRRGVVAWTVQSRNVFADVPLTQHVLTGTPFDLRGYYNGQYRDNSSHVAIVEYRQMVNNDRATRLKRLLSHVGYAAWAGCGFMGPAPGKIEGVLPNLGIGLRIEVQPRMNVRLDFGRNMKNRQNLFYFNMTEAF